MSNIKINCRNSRTLILNSAMLESMEWNENTNTIKFKGAKEYSVTCRSIVELYEYPVELDEFTSLVYELFGVIL